MGSDVSVGSTSGVSESETGERAARTDAEDEVTPSQGPIIQARIRVGRYPSP